MSVDFPTEGNCKVKAQGVSEEGVPLTQRRSKRNKGRGTHSDESYGGDTGSRYVETGSSSTTLRSCRRGDQLSLQLGQLGLELSQVVPDVEKELVSEPRELKCRTRRRTTWPGSSQVESSVKKCPERKKEGGAHLVLLGSTHFLLDLLDTLSRGHGRLKTPVGNLKLVWVGV